MHCGSYQELDDQDSSSALPTNFTSCPSVKLPFTLAEAKADPIRCRALVSAYQWEFFVEQPLIASNYPSELEPRISKSTDSLRYMHYLDESCLSMVYNHGVEIARAHSAIARIIMEGNMQAPEQFEYAWSVRWTDEQREELIVLAHHISGKGAGPRFVGRQLCPDLDPGRLALNEGRELNLLFRLVIQSAVDFPQHEDYYPLIDQRFDQKYQIERDSAKALTEPRGLRAAQTISNHSRQLYIANFLLTLVRMLQYCPWKSSDMDLVLLEKPRLRLSDSDFVRGRNMSGSTLNSRNEEAWKAYSMSTKDSTPPPAPTLDVFDDDRYNLGERLDRAVETRNTEDIFKFVLAMLLKTMETIPFENGFTVDVAYYHAVSDWGLPVVGMGEQFREVMGEIDTEPEKVLSRLGIHFK
ncbi:hypothetical protein JCM5350_005221 [Sporobolomyces pararoseus]